MIRFTPDQLHFARRFFMWASKVRLITWQELNALLYNVAHHERCVAMCYGKEQFQSFALAQRVAHRSRHGDRKHAYHCSVCGFTHIGMSELLPKRRPRVDPFEDGGEEFAP